MDDLEQLLTPDSNYFRKFIVAKMPFGKFKNMLICDLPEYYLIWFSNKGFPEGELGEMMGLAYEIRANGLEPLINKLKK